MRRFKNDVDEVAKVVDTFIAQDSKKDTLEDRFSQWVDGLKTKYKKVRFFQLKEK